MLWFQSVAIWLTDSSLLSRAHSNYLAQINIRMNERQEKTSDILGKLTVLGTIVLPMNVVTGIWGMNCESALS
jgi:magnesium transporter